MTDNNSLTTRLEALESAVVADIMTTMGLENQVAAHNIRPLNTNWKIVGPAICAKGTDNPDSEGLATFGLDDSVYPGGIVVIDTDNCERGAIIGDNMVTSMVNRGAVGFIVDGGIRDYQEFIDTDTPVFCRYTTPVNAHRYWHFTEFETPITLSGIWGDITVNPGDLIIGDADGISVIPQQYASQIIANAEIHQATENRIKSTLLKNGDRKSITAATKRLQHVKRIK
jgi:4-hydroxy-4-methyl-2-oxoglutarate aldolase